MEPLTHFLTGACLGRAGFNRTTALATATMTLAAEASDIDVLGYFKGSAFGFAHHRGFTHSFLGLVLVAGAVVGLMYLIWRARGRKTRDPNLPPRWGLLFFYAYLAGLTHLLLDYTNGYGLRPFWPFSEKWYSWDIVFIADPIIWAMLIAGLALPGLFSLVNEEIGARRKGPTGRLAAALALGGLVTLWIVRDYEHRRAVYALEARVYEGFDPMRASAYPNWWNPFEWAGVVEAQNFYATMLVNSSAPEVDPEGRMQIHYKPEETPVTLAAKRSYLGRVYLDWAQYPITETQVIDSQPGGYLVIFQDLRFEYPGRNGRTPLSAYVKLGRNLNVLAEGVGFRTNPD